MLKVSKIHGGGDCKLAFPDTLSVSPDIIGGVYLPNFISRHLACPPLVRGFMGADIGALSIFHAFRSNRIVEYTLGPPRGEGGLP